MRTAAQDATTLLNGAALSSRLDTTLLPDDLLLVTSPSSARTLAFARGIPASTEQGTAALLSERDLTRTMLGQAGHTVPYSASFLFKADRRQALDWADHAGYPVVASPAWLVRSASSAADPESLSERIDHLARLTERRSPGPAHPRARYLVEKIAGAHRVELCLAHGQVLSRNVDDVPVAEDALHPALEAVALKAIADIPGLEVGRVWLSVDAPTAPPDNQVCQVVDVNPRATFDALHRRDADAAMHAAVRLMSLEAGVQGFDLTRHGVPSRAALTLGGVALTKRSSELVKALCRAQLPDATVTATDSSGLLVRSERSVDDLGALQQALMTGKIDGVRPLFASIEWEA